MGWALQCAPISGGVAGHQAGTCPPLPPIACAISLRRSCRSRGLLTQCGVHGRSRGRLAVCAVRSLFVSRSFALFEALQNALSVHFAALFDSRGERAALENPLNWKRRRSARQSRQSDCIICAGRAHDSADINCDDAMREEGDSRLFSESDAPALAETDDHSLAGRDGFASAEWPAATGERDSGAKQHLSPPMTASSPDSSASESESECQETLTADAKEYDVELVNVRLSFGSKTVLDGLNLKIRKGESTAIIGPSGTG